MLKRYPFHRYLGIHPRTNDTKGKLTCLCCSPARSFSASSISARACSSRSLARSRAPSSSCATEQGKGKVVPRPGGACHSVLLETQHIHSTYLPLRIARYQNCDTTTLSAVQSAQADFMAAPASARLAGGDCLPLHASTTLTTAARGGHPAAHGIAARAALAPRLATVHS